MKAEELRITKVITRVPWAVKIVRDVLKLVPMQNRGVDPNRWAFLNSTSEGSLILGLGEPSVATLKGRNFRLVVGVETVTLKFLE